MLSYDARMFHPEIAAATGLALGTSLINVGNEWLAAATAPLNSNAGIIGMLLPGLHALYRRMVRCPQRLHDSAASSLRKRSRG